jgi:hypothetical protein
MTKCRPHFEILISDYCPSAGIRRKVWEKGLKRLKINRNWYSGY